MRTARVSGWSAPSTRFWSASSGSAITVAVHHTDDPEVLIVELVARATVTTTGHAFTARSIQVFRIRDGKILLFRDSANPNALAEALGA